MSHETTNAENEELPLTPEQIELRELREIYREPSEEEKEEYEAQVSDYLWNKYHA